MNAYDATRMMDVLLPHGYTSVDTPDEADLVFLNTCHIREKAADKVYSELGRLDKMRRQRGDKPLTIGVAGCVAQAEGEEILRRAPYVDIVLGPQTYHLLPTMLRQREETGKPVLMLDFLTEEKFDYLPEETIDKGPVSFLTVQEGCDKFCTYCVVPYTRGIEISRPVEDVLREAQKLVLGGAKEIVFLGQNVSAYHGQSASGKEWGLGDLIREAAQRLAHKGLQRLRYTTSHPRDTQDDLIAAHREVPLLMPYLHLPVQSGSDKVLKEMNRQHPRASYLQTIARFKEAQPGLAISSDFIVGFPGETDAEFKQTMDLVRQVGFAQAYSFKYSPRPGTPGALRTDQVSEAVKDVRLQELQGLLKQQQLDFNHNFLGKTVQVLIEKETKPFKKIACDTAKEASDLPLGTKTWVGRSPFMQNVHVACDDLKPGDICDVRVNHTGPSTLRGDLIPENAGAAI